MFMIRFEDSAATGTGHFCSGRGDGGGVVPSPSGPATVRLTDAAGRGTQDMRSSASADNSMRSTCNMSSSPRLGEDADWTVRSPLRVPGIMERRIASRSIARRD